jgi:Spy/CpxP family protein refolding chaperone
MTHALPLTLAATLALVLTAPLAHAGPGQRGEDGPRAEVHLRLLERSAEQLGLDEATLGRIKDRVYEAEKTGIDLKARLELEKLELRRALDDDNHAKADVMKRIEEVGRLETELRKHQIGLMIDVRAMLTPDQRDALRKMTRRGGRKHGGKSHRRAEPPPPDRR